MSSSGALAGPFLSGAAYSLGPDFACKFPLFSHLKITKKSWNIVIFHGIYVVCPCITL